MVVRCMYGVIEINEKGKGRDRWSYSCTQTYTHTIPASLYFPTDYLGRQEVGVVHGAYASGGAPGQPQRRLGRPLHEGLFVGVFSGVG